jgi:hypothetical protein
MGSLTRCLKKAGLSEHEAAILRGSAKEFKTRDELSAHAAAVEAAKSYLDELEAERADIVQQIEAAGGVVPKPEPAPEPTPEPTPEPAQEPAPVPDSVPRETPEAQQETPEEAKAADLARRIQNNAGALRTMAGEAGWAEIGGRIIRDPDTGEVTGRSKWIPKAKWWPGKPEGMTEVDFRKAVDKAIAGKPLGDRQRLGVEYALQYLEDMEAEAQKAGMDLGDVSDVADDVADAAEDEIGDIPWDSVDMPKRIDAALEKIDWEAMYGRDEAQESSGRTEETPTEPAPESAQASEGKAEAPAGQEVDRVGVHGEPLIDVHGKEAGRWLIVDYEERKTKEEYVDSRGEDRIRWVADWENSEVSAGSGQRIVNIFWLKQKDTGRQLPFGEETAYLAMGVPLGKSQRLARQILDKKRSDEESGKAGKATLEKLAQPSAEEAERYWQKRSDDSRATSAGGWRTILEPKDRALYEKDGKFVSPADREENIKAALEKDGYKRVQWPNQADALELKAQSETELRATEKAQKDAEDKRVAEEKAAEDKRRADAEREDFALTGSTSKADANPNQGDLLSAQAPEQEQKAQPDADAGIKRVNKISSNELSRYQVDAKVFDENSGKYVTEKARADEAWKALRTDIAMMKQLLNCIRGG